MNTHPSRFSALPVILAGALCLAGSRSAAQSDTTLSSWQEQAVQYARIMSRVKWTPIASSMPNRRGGHFQEGTQYTGVPYSGVRSVGRFIGFDIYLKTFLAAVENPQSVLYTEDLSRSVSPNAAAYYGKVCSSYTSYAWQCAFPFRSTHHGTDFRDGVVLVEPQSAQSAEPGDIIFTPPPHLHAGSHVEIVTAVEKQDGQVTAVRVEDSAPPTTRNIRRSASAFDAHLAHRAKRLYRVTDPDVWRGPNKAEAFRFPNYEEDSATPVINRVLLLDRGDWVPYFKEQVVKFHVMDRDLRGVQSLVIKRGGTVVERIALSGTGVIERMFSVCGDYTAHCVMSDGSSSQACEFAVCDLDFSLPAEPPVRDSQWEVPFEACNLDVIKLHLVSLDNPQGRYNVWLTEADRKRGTVVVPAGLIRDTGVVQVWVIGENRHGRLTRLRDITIAE